VIKHFPRVALDGTLRLMRRKILILPEPLVLVLFAASNQRIRIFL
jgi:hypothetical protein